MSQSRLRDDAVDKNKSCPVDHGDKEENATRRFPISCSRSIAEIGSGVDQVEADSVKVNVPGIEAKRATAIVARSRSQECRLGFPSSLSGVEKAK
jgi:hypothetical protein